MTTSTRRTRRGGPRPFPSWRRRGKATASASAKRRGDIATTTASSRSCASQRCPASSSPCEPVAPLGCNTSLGPAAAVCALRRASSPRPYNPRARCLPIRISHLLPARAVVHESAGRRAISLRGSTAMASCDCASMFTSLPTSILRTRHSRIAGARAHSEAPGARPQSSPRNFRATHPSGGLEMRGSLRTRPASRAPRRRAAATPRRRERAASTPRRRRERRAPRECAPRARRPSAGRAPSTPASTPPQGRPRERPPERAAASAPRERGSAPRCARDRPPYCGLPPG